MKPLFLPHLVLLTAVLGSFTALAQAPDPPHLTLTLTNGQQTVRWSPYPAADQYELLTGNAINQLTSATNGTLTSTGWTAPAAPDRAFHTLRVTPLSSNTLFAVTALNRLAYGPTPDELERILTGPNPIGPEAYVEEQLAPELIEDDLDTRPPPTNWTYVTATGVAAPSGRLILYMNGAGDVHIDDLALVEGTVPEAGVNLVQNGDFESPSLVPPYIIGNPTNYGDVAITSEVSHSGANSLHFVANARGSTSSDSFYQQLDIDQTGNTVYTLSFWYLPNPTIESASRTLTVRLSGGNNEGGTGATVSARSGGPPVVASMPFAALQNGTAQLADLRAWYILHCVDSRRQLLEVLTQFVENHFVTQHRKTLDYLSRYYNDGTTRDQIATALEWREVSRWRDALLRPDVTFYDLLKISAESPAMIIYLDTVGSRGDRGRIPNENYARELLELFCNGVDNGYDQNDIVELSKAWTGWTVDVLDKVNIDNPLAPRSVTLIDTNYTAARSNLLGVWTFRYREDWHHNGEKTLFPGRTVEPRFGAPWAGRDYELSLPPRSGPDGLQDGYDVIQHLANLPHTQEFISVKLCRLFVHDGFQHGVYDYSNDSSLSPEARLVRDCMLAWEQSSPQGQLRPVLRTIFDSELFRSHGAASQKVKTPLEYVVSAIRAIHAAAPMGKTTSGTDGYALTGTGRTSASAPVHRMGSMFLFDREEPDGYPESGEPWISAGTLVERIRFVQSFCIESGSGKSDGGNNNVSDPVALLQLKLPPSAHADANAVADYFLSLLYPAEGAANLQPYQSAATEFLNTDTNGTASPFSDLSVASAEYELRVRGALALLLSFHRFHEQ